jgi:Na+-transporting methylmalonyl-CoA/oxaloacetate decarboxylase gamma subunit
MRRPPSPSRSGLGFVLFTLISLLLFISSMSGQTIGTAENSPAADETKKPSAVKVTFDPSASGVVIVESNGERLRIDTARKTVETITDSELTPAAATEPSRATKSGSEGTVAKKKQDRSLQFDKGWEPYDYRIVNVPTPKHIPKGSWNMTFTHRFSQPLRPLDESADDLLGLDSFGIASFGIAYGVTDKLYVSAYRSPVCQRGLCKSVEVGVGYNWLAHDKESPIALTTYASIEGNDNFTEEYTYNLQAMLSARAHKRVYLFFSPAVHFNSNGQKRFNPRATDFFPPATAAVNNFRLPTHGATFGFGAQVLITRNVSVLFDIAARTGFKLGTIRPVLNNLFQVTGFTNDSHPSMGIGVQRNVGKHSFALTFSNTQATTTARYNSSNLARPVKDLIIGFNLSRRF